MKQIEEAQRWVRDALKHVERIAAPQADVGQMLVADVAERRGDAVEERLGADEAMIGEHVGAVGEMLARAEADLEMQRAILSKQSRGRDLALGRNLDLREQRVDELLLAMRAACARSNGRRGD